MPNEKHLSVVEWYRSQGYAGGVQSVVVDGYEGVRDGNSVYVDVANISGHCVNTPTVGCNSDADCGATTCKFDKLKTQIFVMTYSLNSDQQTALVFNQIITNFKFNANLEETGQCEKTTAPCFIDGECASGDYCTSLKARTIRDTKRLADNYIIKSSLEAYKEHFGHYPVMTEGTYVRYASLSTWPSWQSQLGAELGIKMPIDPLNRPGLCAGYATTTCVNAKGSYAGTTTLSKIQLTTDASGYAYVSNAAGTIIKTCATLESGLVQDVADKCYAVAKNHQPEIRGYSFSGTTKQPMVGWVKAFDQDNDDLRFTIDLVNPTDPWDNTLYKWKFDSWVNHTFRIGKSTNRNERQFYATAGRANMNGFYRVLVTVDDMQGQDNSTATATIPVLISGVPMKMPAVSGGIMIGSTNNHFPISGTDSSLEPIEEYSVLGWSLDGVPQSISDLAKFGIIPRPTGMALDVNYSAAQKTGTYKIDVQATDQTFGDVVKSSFTFTIGNHAPVWQSSRILYSNNTAKSCDMGAAPCSFSIDNLESAKVEMLAADVDPGSQVKYRFVGTPPTGLIIDQTTGSVTGFEKLNANNLTEKTFNFTVEAFDQFYANSKPEESSTQYSYSVIVKPYCNVAETNTTLKFSTTTLGTVKAGLAQVTIPELKTCSATARPNVEMTYHGAARSKAIIFVSDLSMSMSGAPLASLKTALMDQQLGAAKRLSDVAKMLPGNYTIYMGLVSFNSEAQVDTPMLNLKYPNSEAVIEAAANSYQPNFNTNTLDALNKAEELMKTIPDDPELDKIIILMSDGEPVVDIYTNVTDVCQDLSCACGDGNCSSFPVADPTVDPCANCPTHVSCQSQGKCGSSCGGTCTDPIPQNSSTTPDCAANNDGCYSYYPAWDSCSGHWYCQYNYNPACYTPCGACPAGCSGCAGNCTCPSGRTNDYFAPFKSYFKSGFLGFLSAHNPLKSVFAGSALAITSNTQCIDMSKQCATPSTCGDYQYRYCRAWGNSTPCTNMKYDVNTEAQTIKNSKTQLYSIYFDTSGNTANANMMCGWSNNNGVNCNNGTYFFTGADIGSMFEKVIGNIVSKPSDVTVGGFVAPDSTDAYALTSKVTANLPYGFPCGSDIFKFTYDSSKKGWIDINKLGFEYCLGREHKPTTPICGDGVKNGSEVCDYTDFGGETCGSKVPGSAGYLQCSADCQTIDTSNCRTSPAPVCGDGKATGMEVCDQNDFAGKSCASEVTGAIGGSMTCASDCKSIDTSGCYTAQNSPFNCGNGIKDTNEACDSTDFAGKTCASEVAGSTGNLICSTDCQQIVKSSCCAVGDPTCFICGTSKVTDEDGNQYNTAIAGGHCWLASNLNVGKMIPYNQVSKNNAIVEKHCYIDNEPFCATYGGLYEWPEAMKYNITPGSRGICPLGWHIPTAQDITDAASYLNAVYAGRYMGYYNNGRDMSYGALHGLSEYISSSKVNQAYYWYSGNSSIVKAGVAGEGYSVRCVKD